MQFLSVAAAGFDIDVNVGVDVDVGVDFGVRCRRLQRRPRFAFLTFVTKLGSLSRFTPLRG